MATPRPASLRVASRERAGERELSNSNSVFSGLSSDIQNDLINSIAQVIRDEIKSEINFAKFVSVIADETPDISHREQMSVIFRYLTKTGIEERFVGFFDVTLERGADQLSQSILEHLPPPALSSRFQRQPPAQRRNRSRNSNAFGARTRACACLSFNLHEVQQQVERVQPSSEKRFHGSGPVKTDLDSVKSRPRGGARPP
ncbi:Zinc finger MYM-type protein 1 [Eumeta japonica]|uniref:Zinc finger MYM-type protein 1 n=1 Tax=Eumeta variegata TaxID=151549 RepID=A0A4C1TRZ0_EUMVA|nr:Zinc finger MYM-type protein 1 [Eumeta japonica]